MLGVARRHGLPRGLGWTEPPLITGRRAVADYREAFVGNDVASLKDAVAELGRDGEDSLLLRDCGIGGRRAPRVIQQITAKFDSAYLCSEADPSGSGLHRLISAWAINAWLSLLH